MYPKFIEVHSPEDGIAVSINVEKVIGIGRDRKGGGALQMTDNSMWQTKESYDELKALITDCGCLIHKADPRLDTEYPLTMHDLKDMLGEPVWNSNIGIWALVRNYIEVPEPDGIDVAFLLDAADNSTGMTAGDLIKTPLYRMRR